MNILGTWDSIEMSSNPLISIITPTFNCAEQADCLYHSIKMQTFTGWEWLIIDGGSTDRIERFSSLDDRIKFSSEPDQGIYDAMNKGISRASGQWLYFIGADDTFHSSSTLERLFAEVEGFDVIYGDVISERFGGRYDGPFNFEKIRNQNICHQAILFNRKVFDLVGCFSTDYPYLSDWEHNLRWMFHPRVQSKYVDLVIANYADSGASSENSDRAYIKDHTFKFVEYARSQTDISYRCRVLASELVLSLKEADVPRAGKCLLRIAQEPFRKVEK